jgi:hypothetical protein
LRLSRSAEEVCPARAGDLLEHGVGELLDWGWQGDIPIRGGVGLAAVGEPVEHGDQFLPVLSDRWTTVIGPCGMSSRGLRAAMAGSFQLVIWPRKIIAITGPVRCNRCPLGRSKL